MADQDNPGRRADPPASQPKHLLQWEAEKRAQAVAGVFAELSGLPPTAAAEELNKRGVTAPRGGKWHAEQVVRVRKRLNGVR
jgi:hypothetical protein